MVYNEGMGESKKKSKVKEKLRSILVWVVFFVVGLAIGVGVATLLGGAHESGGEESDGGGVLGVIIGVAVFLFYFYVALILHIILHEVGHLIAGRMSGYKFLSFSVFGFMIIKKDGKFSWKRLNLPGAAGQCLMIPPKLDKRSEYPFLFYNLGGGLINMIFGGIALVSVLVVGGLPTAVSEMLVAFALVGICVGIGNLFPIRKFSNDGHNIRSLRKDKRARHALRIVLLMAAHMVTGRRVKDMPEEWSEYPGGISDNNDTLSITPVLLRSAVLMDKHEFKEAKKLNDRIIKEADKLTEEQKNELRIESLFCEIMTERRKEEIKRLYTGEVKKYMKATPYIISRYRFQYAYAKLVLHDTAEAEKALEEFSKKCLTYPYEGDIQSEKELIEAVDKLANK